VGQLSLLTEAIELVRLDGRILPFGIYAETNTALPFYNLYFKEIQVVNMRAVKPGDYPANIDCVQPYIFDLKSPITHKFNHRKLDKVLYMLSCSDNSCIKIVLAHNE